MARKHVKPETTPETTPEVKPLFKGAIETLLSAKERIEETLRRAKHG